MKKVSSGGGWPAIRYTLRKGKEVGGIWKLYKALRTKNACKTCALGMGGQRGGMVNEIGGFPEVCKKSLQAMTADMQGAIQPEFWSTYSVAQLKAFSPYDLEHCGRLTQPVLYERGTQYYRPIDWDEAIGRVTKRLKSLPPDETFWYFSGRSSNEAGFLLQLFARLYGTNNVNNCSYYCHQASGVGLTSSIGSGTATVVLDDVEHADLVFVIGGNPPSNHPRLMTTLTHVRQRGGEVIVINPVVETGLVNFRVPSNVRSLMFGTKIATLYVQPDIGGDLALLTGIAKRIDEMGAQDAEFLQNSCEGAEQWLEQLRSVSWPEIHAKSGVSQSDIDAIAKRYAAAKNVVFSWTMGITHHVHGVQNVQAITNLAFMRGMVGRPNAGLLPIRGHSNVQGIGSVGVTPKLKDAIFERLESEYGLRLPTTAGLDTLGCMEAAYEKKLKMGFCLGGNLYGSNPDSTFADESLSRLESLVFLSTTLNTGHAHGLGEESIILPVLARDEEPQPTTQESMFNFVRLSDGGPRRHEGPRSEVEIIARIAEEVLADTTSIDWQSMRNTGRIRDAIAKVVPGYDKIANIENTKAEFQINGRTFHQPTFPTPSGRGVLHRHELPSLRGTGDQLRLMTVRSEGQFNTVVYEEEDLYRGQDRRDVILLHPDDMSRLGLSEEQIVTVNSEAGELPNIRVRTFPNIKPGNSLMYYPESNVLVPRHVDGLSKTPAFKGVLVTIATQ
ncbi:MAG: FdhF/YdeP family oxidoreductase [Planctomycetaceae bacterium]|nr:FdhF/YdeP family oxidoreductase [Planctomycetales bacterium]MCB9927488.1 FdhF/YdeP family oxidoreductase [Planctomycetaceae bacterium]